MIAGTAQIHCITKADNLASCSKPVEDRWQAAHFALAVILVAHSAPAATLAARSALAAILVGHSARAAIVAFAAALYFLEKRAKI